MPLSPDNEADQRWFYTQANGDCGLRSPLGTQLDMLRAGILPGKHERKLSANDDNMLTAGARANQIAHKLNNIPREYQRILELQYGSPPPKDNDVSAPLACTMQSAIQNYHKAKTKSPGKPHTRTMGLWFLWLYTKAKLSDNAQRRILNDILQKSRQALQTACDAYERGQPPIREPQSSAHQPRHNGQLQDTT